MSMQLVIVESPVKAATIEKFLGSNYRALSSYGHIRDLPKSELGIDIENNFKPKYIVPLRAKKNVNILKKESEKANLVILATDEDREGEAIAYHLAFLLDLNGKKEYQRIVFHEITKSAIDQALKNPRKIDMALVDAQQARRILDRIVGYKLSPFLWKKVARGLSAGRVQSVAVRLVVEREREIENFVPQEYWSIAALLRKSEKEFEALLNKRDGKTIPKLGIKTKKEADKIVKD
ncbi:MAG: DNA topoisomerase I, partial [Candidatus Nealsonbacteria bacterium]